MQYFTFCYALCSFTCNLCMSCTEILHIFGGLEGKQYDGYQEEKLQYIARQPSNSNYTDFLSWKYDPITRFPVIEVTLNLVVLFYFCAQTIIPSINITYNYLCQWVIMIEFTEINCWDQYSRVHFSVFTDKSCLSLHNEFAILHSRSPVSNLKIQWKNTLLQIDKFQHDMCVYVSHFLI